MGTWEADDPAYARPIAAPLQRCAELLGVDLVTITGVASNNPTTATGAMRMDTRLDDSDRFVI